MALNKTTSTKAKDWQIIGNSFQVHYLKSNISDNDIAHAYLFVGEEGLGKRTVALSFVKSILCKEENGASFCSACDSCKKIDSLSHPDVAMLDSSSLIKIEEIRGLLSNLLLKPFNSTHKIAIINNAEKMTEEAGNALLKTLEEPTGHAVIILITKNKNLLLPTIVSRTRVLKFFPVDSKEMQKILANNHEEKNAIALLVSAGRPGKLIKITQERELLSFFEKSINDLELIISSDKIFAFKYSESLAKEYEESPQVVVEKIDSWAIILREMLYLRKNNQYKSFFKDKKLENTLKNSEDLKLISLSENLISFSNILANQNSGLNIKLLCDILVLKIAKLGR